MVGKAGVRIRLIPFLAIAAILIACEKPTNSNDLMKSQNIENKVESINKSEWANIGHVSGRIAVAEDMKAGNAVFYSPSSNEPYDMQLPTLAFYHDLDSGEKTKVIVVQAEAGSNGVIIGARYPNGNELVGLLGDFEIIKTKWP